MNNTSEHNIIKKLTGKITLKEVPQEELQSIADEYPFFGAAHFLLAKKIAQQNGNSIEIAQKAALHFKNALWLHYKLFPDEYQFNEPIKIQQDSHEETASIKNEVENSENHLVENDAARLENSTDDFDKNKPGQDEVSEKISGILKEQFAAYEKPVDNTTELIIQPEPSFKTDYFASQGIKLETNKATDDKLSARLHKFTDWLKQMKRVNPQPIDLGTDEATETMVQSIAENSNQMKDVITETMADVFIKQGKTEKAIDIYTKLSLSDPSRSAYFADKISNLKK